MEIKVGDWVRDYDIADDEYVIIETDKVISDGDEEYIISGAVIDSNGYHECGEVIKGLDVFNDKDYSYTIVNYMRSPLYKTLTKDVK